MTTRTLVVKKERLSELTTDDLSRVAGAAIPTVANVCHSLLCPSAFGCSTAPSCGCGPSWTCP